MTDALTPPIQIVEPLHLSQEEVWPYRGQLVDANGRIVAQLNWAEPVDSSNAEHALTNGTGNRARWLAVERLIFADSVAVRLHDILGRLVDAVVTYRKADGAETLDIFERDGLVEEAQATLDASQGLAIAKATSRFAIIERDTGGRKEWIMGFTRKGRAGHSLWTATAEMAHVFDLGDDAQRLHFNELVDSCKGACRRGVKNFVVDSSDDHIA